MEAKLLAEGKTKRIWEGATGYVRIESKDDITAGDGERRNLLEGKAVFSTTTTINCFRLLDEHDVPTHFVAPSDPRTFSARRVDMIPVEIVVRRIATGSYLKRRPDVAEGTILPYVVEFFAKDDARHDPLMIFDFTSERTLYFDPKKPLKEGLIEEVPMKQVAPHFGEPELLWHSLPILRSLAVDSFRLIESAWKRLDVTLVDLKIECGWLRDPGRRRDKIVVADVIDNDSWRIWPGGDKSQMKDKQVYRDSENRTPEELGKIKENYTWVAEQTSKFLPPLPPRAFV